MLPGTSLFSHMCGHAHTHQAEIAHCSHSRVLKHYVIMYALTIAAWSSAILGFHRKLFYIFSALHRLSNVPTSFYEPVMLLGTS